MPRTIHPDSSSDNDENDKENFVSPIRKRLKQSNNEPKSDIATENSRRANDLSTIVPEDSALKTIQKPVRSLSSDLSTAEENLPQKIESSSSEHLSQNSSNDPKVAHLVTSSSSSTTSSSSNFRSSRKRPLATEDPVLKKITEDLSAIIFDIGNLNPIGADSSEDEDDDEEELSNKICCLGDCIVPPVIVPDSSTNDYEVERILLIRTYRNVKFHLVKWKDYPLYQMTWVKQKDLHTCDKVLKVFKERKEVCQTIFETLPNQEKYMGFEDHYVKSFITTSFVEQNYFEVSLVKVMQDNKFAPLYIENWTRRCDVYPDKFVWIAESLFSYPTSMEIKKFDEANKKEPLTTCDSNPCSPKTCLYLKSSITSRGYIRSDINNFINECHKDCECCNKCPSKIFRRGRTIPLMLFRTSKCGWSLRTMVRIPNKKFVMEYVGLIKLFEECEGIVDQTYLFNCDLPDETVKYVIDATSYGNESRFINHHCDPNLDAFAVLGYQSDPGMTRIVFFSRREIEAGEELTFDYFRNAAVPEDVDLKEQRVCRCGAEDCRKYLI